MVLQGDADIARVDQNARELAGRQVFARHQQALAAAADAGQMVLMIVGFHRAFQHGRGISLFGHRQMQFGQQFAHRAVGRYLALFEQHQVIGKARDLLWVVRDVDHRQFQFAMQAFEVGQDGGFRGVIERRQGFVHQQQAGLRGQCPRNRDALPFSAGQRLRPARQQLPDAEQLDDVIQAAWLAHAACFQRIQQIGLHVHVWEQAGFLEYIAHAAGMGRQKVLRVLPGLFADAQQAFGALQPGHAAQDRGLAAAGGAEQRSDAARRRGKRHIQCKAAAARQLKARLNAHAARRANGARNGTWRPPR